ncbi:MAG: glycosyltransferase family 2 protein [Bacteroidota bacterium]
MGQLKATVVVPTTKDRGPLLFHSVGSILRQSVTEIEVFIIGDGVYDETREAIKNIQAKDARVKFFDHPKHESRGETYRHQALQEAKGEIVCYLCDRDLMLPNHIATLYAYLQDYDFASSNLINIAPDKTFGYAWSKTHFGSMDAQPHGLTGGASLTLSCVGHTLEFYRKLPFGWRTTPPGEFTDRHMWIQFITHSKCRIFSGAYPTFLYFSRQGHPGWPVARRLPELAYWSERIQRAGEVESMLEQALGELILERLAYKKASLPKPLRIFGYEPRLIFQKASQKVANLLKPPAKQTR